MASWVDHLGRARFNQELVWVGFVFRCVQTFGAQARNGGVRVSGLGQNFIGGAQCTVLLSLGQ